MNRTMGLFGVVAMLSASDVAAQWITVRNRHVTKEEVVAMYHTARSKMVVTRGVIYQTSEREHVVGGRVMQILDARTMLIIDSNADIYGVAPRFGTAHISKGDDWSGVCSKLGSLTYTTVLGTEMTVPTFVDRTMTQAEFVSAVFAKKIDIEPFLPPDPAPADGTVVARSRGRTGWRNAGKNSAD